VLVDVSPYPFGVSYLGERGGVPYPHSSGQLSRQRSDRNRGRQRNSLPHAA
jgi:hypothetical protein